MRSMFLVGAALGASAAFGGVLNGGFEQRDAEGRVLDWTYDPAFYRVDASGGRNGTVALAFDSGRSDVGSPLQQRVKAVPGLRYRFGCHVRTENLKGKGFGARICLQWEDAYGRFVAGAYYTPHITGTTDGWRKCDGVSELTPKNAAWVTVRPEVVGPITGKAWIDDVFLEPFSNRRVGEMYSSAYRGEQATGTIRFAVDLPVTGESRSGLRHLFAFKTADGRSVERGADTVGGDFAALTVPVADFPLGANTIGFRLVAADGRELGKAECSFTRTETERRRKVAFDRLGRTLVDGKPFFPLGMYWSVSKPFHKYQLPKINARTIAEYAKSPMNTVMPYEAPTREQMDLCEANGLKVIYSLLCDFDSGDWDVTGRDPARLHSKASRRHIEGFRDHPALLAWYVNDEKGLHALPNLKGRLRTVSALDPDHPSWMCVYQYDHMRGYLPTFDVAGSDPYPIDAYPISMCHTYASTVRDRLMGLKPFWQAPQAMDWAAFRTDGEVVKTDRMPTRDELSNMEWQNIAGGANGLIFYSYTYLLKSPTTPFEKGWADVCSATAEVRERFDMLLSDGEPPSFTCGNANVAVRTWRQGERVYVLCVNLTREAQSAVVTLPLAIAGPRQLLGPGFSGLDGNCLKFDLKGIGRAIVEVSARQ